jgi:hypothetical protein
MSQFGGPVHPTMDCTMRGLVTRFFTNMGRTRGWKNPRTSAWLKKFD